MDPADQQRLYALLVQCTELLSPLRSQTGVSTPTGGQVTPTTLGYRASSQLISNNSSLTRPSSVLGSTTSPRDNFTSSLYSFSSPQPVSSLRRYAAQSPYDRSISRGRTELRNLFLPYNTGRPVGIPTPDRSRPIEQEWMQKFFALDDPDIRHSPTMAMKMSLQEEGLGEKFVFSVTTATSSDVKLVLQQTFVKLKNVDFEILKASGGGGIGKPLYRLFDTDAIPSVQRILAAGIRSRTILYIRPLTTIYQDEVISVPTDGIRPETGRSASEASTSSGSAIDLASQHDESLTRGIYLTASSETDPTRMQQPVNADISAQSPSQRTLRSISDFQNYFYSTKGNESFELITVARSTLLFDVIKQYSENVVDINKKLRVEFLHEDGVDLGGLSRELFFKALSDMISVPCIDRHILFEGSDDHKIPTKDGYLLMTGAFKAVGLLMAHSFLTCGVAGFGISKVIVHYLTNKDNDHTSFTYTLEDISSLEDRQLISIIDQWQQDFDLNKDQKEILRDYTIENGFPFDVTFSNRDILRKIIFFERVVGSRKSQLDDIKKAFLDTGITDFLTANPSLRDSAFPRLSELEYTVEAVLDYLDFSGPGKENVRVVFEEVLKSLDKDKKLQQFVVCISGWPVISDRVRVTIGDYSSLLIQTCLQVIEVPAVLTPLQLSEQLHLAVADPCFSNF